MDFDIKVLTCNIRCMTEDDGTNNWPYRKDMCLDIIVSQDADIVCFQELTKQQEDDISERLAPYQSFGLPDEPLADNSVNRVFYKKERFTLVASGGYWLSETPHIPGSRSWGSVYIRLANWLRLREPESGIEFRLINTHLECDNREDVRQNQGRCIVEDTQAFPDEYPQILTGDMNCNFTSPTITGFKDGGWRDTYTDVHDAEHNGNTYHQYLGPLCQLNLGKIDWIMARGKVQALRAEVVTDSITGRYPSDHYFVNATVRISE